jgi:hypothetical protein
MPQADLLDANRLAPQLLELITSAPMPKIGQVQSCPATTARVESVLEQLPLKGTCAEAGLWILSGKLDRSHTISQEILSAEGSYWHALMHRSEGDFSNAKYWTRRAARHPVRAQLSETVQARSDSALHALAATGGSDPKTILLLQQLNSADLVAEALIDLVELAFSKQTELSRPLQLICWWEWQLLFRHCLS